MVTEALIFVDGGGARHGGQGWGGDLVVTRTINLHNGAWSKSTRQTHPFTHTGASPPAVRLRGTAWTGKPSRHVGGASSTLLQAHA